MANTAVATAAPDPGERVVVLAKPGDLLLIGNAGGVAWQQAQLKAATDLFTELGIRVAFFADDIDISKLPADA